MTDPTPTPRRYTLLAGASGGLGRALAEELARAGHDLILAAGSRRDLEALAADLESVHAVRALALPIDLTDRTVAQTLRSLDAGVRSQIAGLVFAAGYARENDSPTDPPEAAEAIWAINLFSVQAITAECLPAMLERGRGFVLACGSVAAIRGRSANAAYAAAKRALESWLESLAHAVAPKGVSVHCCRMGYLQTQQTFGRTLFPPPADPARVARAMVRALPRPGEVAPAARRARFRSVPWWWAPLGWALRAVPWRLYLRSRF